MVLKVCLRRPAYPDIGLNLQQNPDESVLTNGVPDLKIQKNTTCFTNSTENLFTATEICKIPHVLGLDPMECTVAGPLYTNTFLLLLLTIALTLATP